MSGESDEKILFKLDLDAKDFKEGIAHSKELLKTFGETESLGSLMSTLGHLGVAAGVLAVAFYGVKTALDLTMEAESIKRTEEQFKMLTEEAGIATETLRNGLEEASHGLVGMDELLKSSNQAIIAMGKSAERLPEVLEFATKATKIFGGEVNANYEKIANALATGRVRALKEFGITIDATKAVKEFAEANGLAVAEISEAGKRQAIMNQALAQAESRFKTVKVDTGELTTSWQKFRVAVKETYETFALMFDSAFGKWIKGAVSTLSDAVISISNAIRARMGDHAAQMKIDTDNLEKYKAKVTELSEREAKLAEQYQSLTAQKQTSLANNVKLMIDNIEKQKEALLKTIDDVQKRKEETEQSKDKVEETKGDAGKDAVDREKREKARTQFEKDLAEMRAAKVESEMATNKDVEQVETLFNAQMEVLKEQHEAKMKEIELKDYLNPEQKLAEKTAEQDAYNSMLKRHLDDQVKMKEDADKRMMNSNDKSTKAMSAGVRSYAAQATKNFDTTGKRASMAMQVFSNHAVSALKDWASGSATASEAVRGFMLGAIGDMAEASGRFMMLDAFKTYPAVNFPELAAGAGLVALSGVLSGLGAKSSGSTGSASAGGGASDVASGGGGDYSSASTSTALAEDAQKKKAVSVVIHGNYMETETTRRQLLEMIRQETDATSFSYSQVQA